MKWAVGGWSLFIVENYILSENRTFIINTVGDDNYHYIYGTCSTAATASIAYAFFRKIKVDSLPLRWPIGQPVPPAMMMLGFTLQAVGMTMASQALPRFQIPFVAESAMPPQEVTTVTRLSSTPPPSSPQKWKVRCPFDFTDSKSFTENGIVSPTGLDRITRHPGLWSAALLGLGTAVMTPSLPRAVWWGMPTFVALVGGAHTDSRFRRGMGGVLDPAVDETTSNLPFWAMITGRQGSDAFENLVFKEGKGINAALAVGAVGIWIMRKGRGGMVKVAV